MVLEEKSEEERRAGLTLPILPLPRPQSSSPLSLCLCPMNGLPHGQNGKDSFVYLRGMDPREDEDTVSIGELPDRSLSGEFGGSVTIWGIGSFPLEEYCACILLYLIDML